MPWPEGRGFSLGSNGYRRVHFYFCKRARSRSIQIRSVLAFADVDASGVSRTRSRDS